MEVGGVMVSVTGAVTAARAALRTTASPRAAAAPGAAGVAPHCPKLATPKLPVPHPAACTTRGGTNNMSPPASTAIARTNVPVNLNASIRAALLDTAVPLAPMRRDGVRLCIECDASLRVFVLRPFLHRRILVMPPAWDVGDKHLAAVIKDMAVTVQLIQIFHRQLLIPLSAHGYANF
jgi:hypothetical protein